MAVKIKGKQWCTIVAPKVFGEKDIGKARTAEPQSLVGKRLILNAIELMDDMNKYYVKFKFKIDAVNGTRASTVFDGFECMQDYISRMVLRRIKRIDSVQDLKTQDNVKLRVKGLTVMSKKVRTNVEAKIRKYVVSIVKEEVENSTLEEFISKVMNNEIKNRIIRQGRIIYPVRNFEIRKTEVLKE
ncbi:MAG: hypothetical protein HYT70_00750 [Candidatus Aenigmarchaeota archaeon]|nr:hypothetical protein [Candidatus Aenigmarchaeota archaeon]